MYSFTLAVLGMHPVLPASLKLKCFFVFCGVLIVEAHPRTPEHRTFPLMVKRWMMERD